MLEISYYRILNQVVCVIATDLSEFKVRSVAVAVGCS